MNYNKILNPNVRKKLISEVFEPFVLSENGSKIVYDFNRSLPETYFEHLSGDRILLIDPVGYLEMIWFLKNCSFVITDSGGLQKEAYFFKKICITLRSETEWTELVEAGLNFLVGSDFNAIIKAFNSMPSFRETGTSLYGKGDAANKIANFFLNYK